MLLFLKLKNYNKKWRRSERLMKKLNERKRKKTKKKNDVLKCLEGDLELLHAGIRVAENAVEEGNRLW